MAVLVAYRTSNGRLLWWAVDADPAAFRARSHETIIEMPAEDHARGVHPQAYITGLTGLDPKDDDKFVELDERGGVKRVFYDEPGRRLNKDEKRYKAHKEDVRPKDGLPHRDEPYTV